MSSPPQPGERRAHAVVYFGGYAAAPGHPQPQPPAPDGPWRVEEWDGISWTAIGTAETRADLEEFGIKQGWESTP